MIDLETIFTDERGVPLPYERPEPLRRRETYASFEAYQAHVDAIYAYRDAIQAHLNREFDRAFRAALRAPTETRRSRAKSRSRAR